MPCGSPISSRVAVPGWPRASRRRPSGCSPPRSRCGAVSPTATGRTRRSPTRSGGGWPRSVRVPGRRCSRHGWPWGRTPRSSRRLERLLADDPLKEEWWRLLVLALYRSGRQGDALAAVARARAVLVEQLGAEPGPRLRADRGSGARPGSGAGPAATPVRTADVAVCPYKGLATYQAADAALFHGRGRVVNRLVARLVDAPLLVVSGASGAGKSSLVRAGLSRRWQQERYPAARAGRPSSSRRDVDRSTPWTR